MSNQLQNLIKLREKINQAQRIHTSDQKEALEELILTKEEVERAIELGTPLHEFKFFLQDISEEYFLKSLETTPNNFQYIPNDKKTNVIHSKYLKTCSASQFPSAMVIENIDTVDFIDFFKRVDEDDKVIKNLYSYNYDEVKSDSSEEFKLFMSDKIKAMDRFMIAIYEYRGNIDNIIYVKGMDDSIGMSDSIVSYIEKKSETQHINLDRVYKDKQTRKMVENAIEQDSSNILKCHQQFVKTEHYKIVENMMTQQDFSHNSILKPFLKLNPEIMTPNFINKLFQKNKKLFLQVCDLVQVEDLTDGMVMEILKAKLDYHNVYSDKLIKTRVTQEMLDLLVTKYKITDVITYTDIFPEEMLAKYIQDTSEIYSNQLKESGYEFFKIPKTKQTQKLLDIAMYESEYPISESRISSKIFKINPELTTTQILIEALWGANREKAQLLIKEYFTNDKLQDYNLNLAMASNINFWEIINKKLVDEKLIFKMLGKITSNNKEEILPKVEKMSEFIQYTSQAQQNKKS